MNFELDPKDSVQMLALSRFAATLAGENIGIEIAKKEQPKPAAKKTASKPEKSKPAPVEEDEGQEAESQDAEEVTQDTKGQEITLDDIRRAVAEKKDKHLAAMKEELSSKYGVKTTPKLDPEHYPAFFEFINSLD